MKKVKNIKFQNRKRPELDFDLVDLKELLSRKIHHITQPHRIDFFQILIITQGKGFHTVDTTDYAYKKGTIITTRKDQVHRFSQNPNAKGYLLLFTEDFLTSHFEKGEILRAFHLFNELLISPKFDLEIKEFNEVLKLIESIEAEYKEHIDEFSRSIIRSALHMLVIKLFRLKSKNNEVLSKRKYFYEFIQLQQLIEKNYTKTRKVADYAEMMNCTAKTLNNVCRAILDKSVKSVINDIVIMQIKRLLINTTLTITEIAYESGFDEPTNMFRYFKKSTNRSPESYRSA